jgi:repressor LexA
MKELNIGDKIKLLREQNHLTLEQVGKDVGVGKSTVRKWETGAIANMRRDKIALLAKALHTTPAYLMGWDEETPAIKPVERKLTNNEKIFLEEIKDLTEEEQQKVLDFIHFTKSQRTKRINLSPGTELAAFGGDFVSKPKKKKPEIL